MCIKKPFNVYSILLLHFFVGFKCDFFPVFFLLLQLEFYHLGATEELWWKVKVLNEEISKNVTKYLSGHWPRQKELKKAACTRQNCSLLKHPIASNIFTFENQKE